MKVSLNQRLKANALTLGSWISLGHPAIAEILARAGFDWLVVDLEHSTISIEQAGELIRVIDLCGVAPLVRLTSNEPDQIKRVTDAGTHGIVLPTVNSADEAARAVAPTRYASRGIGGVGVGRAQRYAHARCRSPRRSGQRQGEYSPMKAIGVTPTRTAASRSPGKPTRRASETTTTRRQFIMCCVATLCSIGFLRDLQASRLPSFAQANRLAKSEYGSGTFFTDGTNLADCEVAAECHERK